ncbi:hypothetical protein PROPHIGD104-2_18 [Mycobacterium phage prophi104-2]|nr:hypothetical protein PROPHIGD104-2_18 [Mycobacterium phage prophi104-2]
MTHLDSSSRITSDRGRPSASAFSWADDHNSSLHRKARSGSLGIGRNLHASPCDQSVSDVLGLLLGEVGSDTADVHGVRSVLDVDADWPASGCAVGQGRVAVGLKGVVRRGERAGRPSDERGSEFTCGVAGQAGDAGYVVRDVTAEQLAVTNGPCVDHQVLGPFAVLAECVGGLDHFSSRFFDWYIPRYIPHGALSREAAA